MKYETSAIVRIPYHEYVSTYGRYGGINGTYDAESKTIEVRINPEFEAFRAVIPDDAIRKSMGILYDRKILDGIIIHDPRDLYVDAHMHSEFDKREVAKIMYQEMQSMILRKKKPAGSSPEWLKDAYHIVKGDSNA